MKTSINKLRTELQSLILANGNINRFYWKDLNRAMAENRDINYPLVCAFYPTATLTMNQDRIQLTIDVADKIYQDYTNLNDVESDTLNICRQLFNGLQSVRWKKIGRIESCTVRKFVATHSDFVAGHSMTVDFNLRDLNGVCDLPFFDYDFEQVVSGEATQVTVFNSDMSYSQLVDCGSTLQLPDVSYLVKNSADDVLASATVPSVNNIETTLADVDNIDSDGQTVPTPAGVAFTCTPQIVCADGTVNVNKSDSTLISAVSVASGATVPYNVADSTAVLKNTLNTTLLTEAIKATESEDITAPDATATLNGNAFGSVPSGVTVDIELVDQTDTPIVPDSVVGTKITVTVGGAVPIGAKILKTGRTVSVATGDDGDIQAGRLANFLTLPANNPFGNTNRFTTVTGGVPTNGVTQWLIDWTTYDGSTVEGYVNNFVSFANMTWLNALSFCNSYSLDGFSGARMINRKEGENLMNSQTINPFDYAPFLLGFGLIVWTSTSPITDYPYTIEMDGRILYRDKNDLWKPLPIRTFTVNGTTLT